MEQLPHLAVKTVDSGESGYPRLSVLLEENPSGLTVVNLVLRLLEGDPAVAVSQEEISRGHLILNPMSLAEDQLEWVIERFRSIVAG